VLWPAVRRAFPDPFGLAVWIAMTVLVPLVYYEATHRWEEDQAVSMALRWTLAAVPVLAAMAAARSGGKLLVATVAGILVSAVFLAGTLAFYAWIIPLHGAMYFSETWVVGLLLAVAGGAAGSYFAPAGPRHNHPPTRWGYLGGAVVAVAGALLAPVIVQLGAEDSTGQYDDGQYGGIGVNASSPGKSGILELPAAGRYSILAMGSSPQDPACLVSGPGSTSRQAELISIPPSDYGHGDFASYAWVASFTVPGPGTYSLTCRTSDAEAEYTVGAVPQIRGAVGALIHWPLVVIWLLGSIPGLLIIADTFRRCARQAEGLAPE
jgi:hypothetical protein